MSADFNYSSSVPRGTRPWPAELDRREAAWECGDPLGITGAEHAARHLNRLSVDGGPLVEVARRPSGLIRALLAAATTAGLIYGALLITGVT